VRRQHGIEALGRRLPMRAILVMGARGKLDPSASTRSWASTTSILDLVGASQVVRCARGLRGPVRPIARSVKPGYGRSDEPPNRQRYQKRIYFVRLDNVRVRWVCANRMRFLPRTCSAPLPLTPSNSIPGGLVHESCVQQAWRLPSGSCFL
jgi:hypothetical protein